LLRPHHSCSQSKTNKQTHTQTNKINIQPLTWEEDWG